MPVAALLLAVAALVSVAIAWVKVLVLGKELVSLRQAQRKPMEVLRGRLDKLEKAVATVERALDEVKSSVQPAPPPAPPPPAPMSAPVAPPAQTPVAVDPAPEPPAPAPQSMVPPQPVAPPSPAYVPVDPAPAPPAPEVSPVPEQKGKNGEQFINFDCMHCRQNIDAPITMVGEKVPCPTCAILLSIPRTSAAGSLYRPEAPVGGGSTSTGFRDTVEDASKDKTVRIDISHMELAPSPKIRKITVKRRKP